MSIGGMLKTFIFICVCHSAVVFADLTEAETRDYAILQRFFEDNANVQAVFNNFFSDTFTLPTADPPISRDVVRGYFLTRVLSTAPRPEEKSADAFVNRYLVQFAQDGAEEAATIAELRRRLNLLGHAGKSLSPTYITLGAELITSPLGLLMGRQIPDPTPGDGYPPCFF